MDNFAVIFYTTPSHDTYGRRIEKYCQHHNLYYMWYTEDWLKRTLFWSQNEQMLSNHYKGAGYWCWKPYIILDGLERFKGMRILYLDSSVVWDVDPRPYITDWVTPWVCKAAWPQKQWTKRDCFVYMGCDNASYWDAPHVWAGCQMWAWKDGELLFEYQRYVTDMRIVSDNDNVCGKDNLPEFQQHRHDQSILANMMLKHGLATHDMPRVNNESLFYDGSPSMADPEWMK